MKTKHRPDKGTQAVDHSMAMTRASGGRGRGDGWETTASGAGAWWGVVWIDDD